MLFTGTTCNDLPPALDLGEGVLSLPADQGRTLVGVEGVKPPEALEILQSTLAKNAKNTLSWSIYTKLQFGQFC